MEGRTLIRRRFRGLTVVALAATLALTGCATSANDAGSSTADAGTPVEGGDLSFLIGNFDTGFQPQYASWLYESQVWAQITDKLVYVDDQGETHPWLAESWEGNDDSTSFTLHLRDGVTFSDGSALDAETVAANIDLWANGDESRGISPSAFFPDTYDGYEVVDPQTLTVNFTKPTINFIPNLGYHGHIILGKTTVNASAEDQADLSQTVGSGPFVVEEFVSQEKVVLKKREDYNWPNETAQHTGAAYLDTITFTVVPEASNRSSAVESGQADIAHNVPSDDLDPLKAEGFQVDAPRYLGGVHGLNVNTSHEILQDVNVRKAVQFGIDRQEILDTVYTEDWIPATSIFQANVPETIDLSAEFAYNPDEANTLLDNAGWVTGSDGIREKDGKRLSLIAYPSPYVGTSQDEWELIAQQLAKIGIEIELKSSDISSYSTVRDLPELGFFELNNSFVDASSSSAWWASNVGAANWGSDFFKLKGSDPELDDLFAQIRVAENFDDRKELLAEVQRRIIDNAYFIPLESLAQSYYLSAPNVQGVVFDAIARPSYYDTWLSES